MVARRVVNVVTFLQENWQGDGPVGNRSLDGIQDCKIPPDGLGGFVAHIESDGHTLERDGVPDATFGSGAGQVGVIWVNDVEEVVVRRGTNADSGVGRRIVLNGFRFGNPGNDPEG